MYKGTNNILAKKSGTIVMVPLEFVSSDDDNQMVSVFISLAGYATSRPGPGWGPVRVGALSGLGPSPGWGPFRVGAHIGPYMGPYGPLWVLLDRSWKIT